jgi:hypothetical protein
LKYSKNLIVFVSIFLSLLLVSKLGFIFYESFTETHFKFISQGYFFNGKPDAMVNTFGCYIFLGDIFKYLAIKWDIYLIEVFILFSISLLLFNTYFLINNTKNKLPQSLKIGIYFLTFLIATQIESVKIAILLSGISTLLFLYQSQLTVYKRLYLYACIIIGLCIRIEGGALSIIFICLVYLVLSKKSLVQFAKLAIIILPVVLLYTRVNTPMNLKEAEYIQLRPYQFSLWDFNKDQNIDFKSTKDSTIFNSSVQFFLSDKNKMSPENFKEIGVLKNDKSPTDFFNTLRQKKLDTSQLHLNIYKQLLYSFFAISFIFIVIFSRQKIHVVFIWISGFATLLIIWVLMKMELRIIEPFIVFILLYSIYIGQIHIEKRNQKASMIFSILFVLVSILNLYQYYLYQKTISNNMGKTMAYLNNLPENSKIIVNLHPLVSWNNTVLKKNPILENNHLLSIDNGLFFLQKYYDQYLIELYGSSDYKIVFKKIADDHSTYFVSDSYRMKLLSDYSLYVYGIKWNFTKIKKFNIAEKDIYVYQFNKE